MRNARLTSLVFALALIASPLVALGEPGERSPFGNLQIQSSDRATEISLGLPATVHDEDLTKTRPGLSASGAPAHVRTPRAVEAVPQATPTPAAPAQAEAPPPAGEGEEKAVGERKAKARPGALTVNEIHLFFPGATLDRPRAITVGDPIIQETRLFPDEGGVSMTVVVRRPVYYVVSRGSAELRIHVEPGTLLLAAPSPAETPKPGPAVTRGPRAPRRPGAGPGIGGAEVDTGALVPKVTMPALRKGEGLTVDAEHLSADEETNEIVAKGHVTIARAGSLLTADEVRINRDTQRAQARGNVQFTDPQGSVQADSFTGNLEDETGELTNGTVFLNANHLTIRGTKLEKSFGQTYHIENGEFTTCQCGAGTPSWSIAGKSIDVTLDGYGMVEGAKFKVANVPVLYLPLAPVPTKKTRQSGLLAPQFGYSNKWGFMYLQPFYLAVNKSVDFTVAPDIQTESRLGAVTELRYALSDKSKAVVNFAYYNEFLRNNANSDIVDTTIADPDIPQNRWSETASIEQELPFGLRAFADSLAVSDSLYLREINTYTFDPEYERTLRTSRFSSSTGGLYRSWEHATLILNGTYYQDFIQDQDQALQRLPQAQLFASDRFLNRRLKLGIDAGFVNFARKQGFDGPRFDFAPTATVPLRWQEYLSSTFQLQLRETAYHLSNTDLLPVSQSGVPQPTPTEPIPTTQSVDRNQSRELLQASAVLGTEISRVFDVGGENVQKLKHTIEPEVDYLYVPDVNQDDLPVYDFVDRINRRNRFTYGFTSRLLAKFEQPLPIEIRRPRSVGDLNPFTGRAASPFDDENTRGGLAALGVTDPEDVPYGMSTTPQEIPRGATMESATGAPEEQNLTAEQRAAKLQEEKSARSNVVEWLRLQLFQTYDLRDSLQTTSGDTSHFSDVDAHIRLSPVNYFSLIYDSTVNAEHVDLTSANVGFLLRDPRERKVGGLLTATQRAAVAVSYRFVSDGVLQEVDDSVLLPIADTLSLFFMSSYDALQKQFLNKVAGFRVTSQCQCWIADLSVADRSNPDETQVRFQVTLVGLGSIGRAR
jgi:LPS-assembly protein